MNAIDSALRPWANWPMVIGAAIVCATYFAAQSAYSSTFKNGQSLLDIRWSYTADEAQKFFDDIGPVGRQRYLVISRVTDRIFPICYVLGACLLMVCLDPDQKRSWLLILPIAAGLCDWGENFGIAGMNQLHPSKIPDWLVSYTLICTRLKWGLILSCAGINGGMLVLQLAKWPAS